MNQKPLGILLMAYGTPRSLEEVEAYYTHIRRGRAPAPEQLDDLIRRYEAIGGVSPLNEITRAEGAGIEAILNQDGGRPVKVYLGMKHAHPFIEEAIQEMTEDGIEEAVTLVLAPHYSTMSVGAYQKTADEATVKWTGPKLWHVDSWHLHPRFINLLSAHVATALQACSAPDEAMVIFSAHSLPERILSMGDPYPTQLQDTGNAVAGKLGLKHHMFAWQSAGRTAETWLGPDVLDVLRELRVQGTSEVVICPAGFVSDHLEVLYDIDIECQTEAKQLGLTIVRTRSLNVEPEFLRALAEVIREREQRAASDNEVGTSQPGDTGA